jgi:hypothetical protein
LLLDHDFAIAAHLSRERRLKTLRPFRDGDTQLAAGQWGEVSVVRADGVVRVAVTGMSAPYISLRQNSGSTVVGVIGSWNLVRFDYFVFNAQRGPN